MDASTARGAAVAAIRLLDSGGSLDASDAARFGVTGLRTTPEGLAPPDMPTLERCHALSVRFYDMEGIRYAVACAPRARGAEVVWAWRVAEPEHRHQATVFAIGIAGIVGISTALGILQLLSPLTRVPEGLHRLASGERGVHLAPTGLREVDELIDHLNAAARAMEDREDAIRGRIEVVQEIARLVAHEVRNPLQTMEILAELIGAETNPDERAELAETLRHEIRILESLVARLLREQGGGALRVRRNPVSINDLMARVVSLRRPEARVSGISLVLGAPVDVVVDADGALLSRAVENCVSNALAFVPARTGVIEVHAEVVGEEVHILIDDNGPGVPEDLDGILFQSGISRREGGTGLGLVFVRGVASAHGGYADHHRSPLGGARFRISLPRANTSDREESPP